MRRTVRDLALCTGVAGMLAATASAQQPVPAPTEKWEVSVHLGGLFSTNPSGGSFTSPPGNASLALATGGSGRRISSWYLGDGAKLLNDMNAALGVSQRVTTLDEVLRGSMVQQKTKLNLGFRISRVITRRLTAEVAVDYTPGGARVRDSVVGGVLATRNTFVNALRPMLLTASTSPPQFVTTSSVGLGSGGQILTTAVMKVALRSTGQVTPFVTAGAGVASRFGQLPAARVEVRYTTFGFVPCACPVDETDRVLVHTSVPGRSLVGVVGAGLDIQPGLRFWRGRSENTSRWGIRLDARVYLSGSENETFVNTFPSVRTMTEKLELEPNDGSASGVLTIDSPPGAQFSNDPLVTGFDSTLTGQPLKDFRVFEGGGVRARVAITTGLFVRF